MIQPDSQPAANSVSIIVRRQDAVPISETWDKFYNGPNAGKVDIEAARREMPWLIGEALSVTISTTERQN